MVTERESWILDNKDRDAESFDREECGDDRAGTRTGDRRVQKDDLSRK